MTIAIAIEKGYKIIKLTKLFHKCGEEYIKLGYSEEIKKACCHCPLRYKCMSDDSQKCLSANKYLQFHFSLVPPGPKPNVLNISIKREWLDSSIRDLVNECEEGINASKEVKNG